MHTSRNNWYKFVVLPDKKFLIAIMLLSIGVASYLGYLTPRLISDLYESYGSTDIAFKDAVLAIVVVFVAEYVNQVIYQFSINKYMQHLIQHARSISFSSWLLSYEAIKERDDKKYPLGELLARIMSDTEAMMELVGSGSFKIFIDVAFIGSCLISFLSLNTTSGIFLIIAEILACAVLLWGSKYMGKIYLEVRKSNGMMARSVSTLTAGTRTTYYTPNGGYASKKSLASFEDFLQKQLKANVWDASYYSMAESLFPLLLALLVIVFPYSNIVEMAVLAAIIDLIQRSINPIKDMSSKVSSIQRARSGLIRIQEFNNDIQAGPASKFDDYFEPINFASVEVCIEHFEYPKKIADQETKIFSLDNIHFKAERGQLVGIVGLSGSGKSTVLKILATDILCDSAHIKIETNDGKELVFNQSKYDELAQYKHQVSMVSQDSHVFTESLQFNITLGQKSDAEFQEFWQRVGMALPYLKKWQVKPQDIIQSADLSMGQKQLIAALRSCFLTKPIVLFDEISSGLDSELEQALRELVLLIQKKSLTIIVAHRIETIVKSNLILVMDKGKLEAQGTHETLLRDSATYQEFIAQLRALQ